MPEITIQRRAGVPWWMWLIGAILLALILWWLISALTPDRPATTGGQPGTAGTESGEMAGGLPLASIASDPSSYVGRSVEGSAAVSSVVSDRSFWIESGGQRMLAVIDESAAGRGEMADINAGQRLRFQGTVQDAASVGQSPGLQNLDAETRQIIQSQPAFINVHSWSREDANQ